MLNYAPRHFSENDEVAQTLKRLQQDKKAQLCGFTLGGTGRKFQLGLSGRIKINQLSPADTVLQAWVRRIVNGRHESSRLRGARPV
jgi:hypothetical protein